MCGPQFVVLQSGFCRPPVNPGWHPCLPPCPASCARMHHRPCGAHCTALIPLHNRGYLWRPCTYLVIRCCALFGQAHDSQGCVCPSVHSSMWHMHADAFSPPALRPGAKIVARNQADCTYHTVTIHTCTTSTVLATSACLPTSPVTHHFLPWRPPAPPYPLPAYPPRPPTYLQTHPLPFHTYPTPPCRRGHPV